MKSNKFSVFIGLIFLVVITSITTLLLFGNGTFSLLGYSSSDIAFINKMMQSKKVLMSKYYEDISEKELFEGAMSGMFASVDDPYTEYLPAEASETLETIASGKYEGVGIVVTQGENYPLILHIIEDSPASKAGLKADDEILKINDISCENIDLNKAVEYMKVKAGSQLKLLIKREEEELNIELKTEEISLPSVYSENFDGIGYIEISSFGTSTFKEFKTKYDKLREENIESLIIDLRDNGGGVYEDAVNIAKILVPEGLIVYTEDKDGIRKEEKSTGKGIDIPLVVLVNENSASASEVLAGAIKDRGCGTLVGKKTYGKGVVQGWFKIGDGTSIKLTIAKYFTPNGICIDGIGIEPDVEVEESKSLVDTQLNKAKELLKK